MGGGHGGGGRALRRRWRGEVGGALRFAERHGGNRSAVAGQERGDEALDLLRRAGLVDRRERDERPRQRNHEVGAVAGPLLDGAAVLDPPRGPSPQPRRDEPLYATSR